MITTDALAAADRSVVGYIPTEGARMMTGDRSTRRRGLQALAVGLAAGALTLGVAPTVSAAPAVSAAPSRAADANPAAALVATPLRLGPVRIVTYRNCTDLQRVHRHGVGKKGAVDKVRGRVTASRVKTFLVNSALYAKNVKLDRDKDGVACEKK